MVAKIKTFVFQGIKTIDVNVEVKIQNGFPSFNIVGLADKSINESKERVRSAINSLNLEFPTKKITVNLTPANIEKDGSYLDLPIALGILMEMNIIPYDIINDYIVMGELSLDGNINYVNGILIATMSASDVISKIDENNKFSLESQDKFKDLDLLNVIFNESEDVSESYMYRIVCCDGGEYGNVQAYITRTEQFINDLNDYLKIADASASIESNCIKTSAGELRFATEDEFFQALGFQSAINLQYRINGYQDILNAMKTNQKALEKTKKALGVLLDTDLGNLSDFGDMTSGVKAMGDISKSIGNTAKGVSQALKESINNFSLQDFCWSVGVSPNKLSDSEQKQVFATFFAGGKTNTKYTRGMKHIEMYARGLEVIKDAKDKDEIIDGFQRILDSAVGSADYEIRLKSLLGLSRKIGKDFTKFVKDNIK